jgi:hypothetical protein
LHQALAITTQLNPTKLAIHTLVGTVSDKFIPPPKKSISIQKKNMHTAPILLQRVQNVSTPAAGFQLNVTKQKATLKTSPSHKGKNHALG